MYKINEVAKLANISTRTLRYYDKIGLLVPTVKNEANYRFYNKENIAFLQQILFYKRLGFKLEMIKSVMINPEFNHLEALQAHRVALQTEKAQLNSLLATIDKTIKDIKGEVKMSDKEKFIGFKETLIKENEEKYGEEIRSLYGEDTVDLSYQQIRKMSKWEMDEANRLSKEILSQLEIAFKLQDPQSNEAKTLCTLHQTWIQMYWPTYSKEAHLGLVKMYTVDERFTAYYDKVAQGATLFLYQAMKSFLEHIQ